MLEEPRMILSLIDEDSVWDAEEFIWDSWGFCDAIFYEEPGLYDYYEFMIEDGDNLYWKWQVNEWEIEDCSDHNILKELFSD